MGALGRPRSSKSHDVGGVGDNDWLGIDGRICLGMCPGGIAMP